MTKNVTMSRAERCFNPGQLRKTVKLLNGEVRPSIDPELKQFVDMDYGFRAMWSTLKTYYYRYRLTTIGQIVPQWGTATIHKDLKAYTAFVVDTTGIAEHQQLKFTCEEMGKVVLAIAHYESGYSKEEWEASCRQAFNMLFKKHR